MADSRKANKKGESKRGLLARPLESLVFLAPLIVFYEVAVIALEPSELTVAPDRVVAFQLLQTFFDVFGVRAMLMPGLAVVAILIATHIASREPWRVRKVAVATMYVEAVAWAIPLTVLSRYTQMAATEWPAQSLVASSALCVGAGIYEELVFRLVLISLIVIIGADLMRFPQNSTLVAAVLVAAGLFSLHHHPPFGGEPFDAFRFTFRAMAGVYLGAIFVFRGYGPAAGAHIAYNLIVIAFAT